MNESEMKNRTKQMALRVIKMVESLPKNRVSMVFTDQILRSSTSTAANYRAACRAKSKADFIYKLGIVEEESDETEFWIEMIIDAGLIPSEKMIDLKNEVNQITKIISASKITASKNYKSKN
ncbi:MAG: four helix bundle protein [Bacteroidetes bacterium]|nr:four helix bundle protein [Bacteroidota bacterium]